MVILAILCQQVRYLAEITSCKDHVSDNRLIDYKIYMECSPILYLYNVFIFMMREVTIKMHSLGVDQSSALIMYMLHLATFRPIT